MRLHIIRHGDPDYVNDSLTDLGHKEAQLLSLRMEKLPIKTVFSSPLGRAKLTAKYTADKINRDIIILDWAKELQDLVVPEYVGILPSPVAGWNLSAEHLREIEHRYHQNWEQAPVFNEQLLKKQVQCIQSGWKKLLEDFGVTENNFSYVCNSKLPEKDIVIFCHMGFALTFLSLILHIPTLSLWRTTWLAPSSITTVLFENYEENKINLRMTCIGDTSHLYGACLQQNTSGIMYNNH